MPTPARWMSSWLAASTAPEAGQIAGTQVAVDGKTVHGAVQADGRAT